MALTIPGEIITFYSYKGGVGRSMALANVACLLARRFPQKILMIDWDLEAPGLHWFFQKRSPQFSKKAPHPTDLQEQPGLIDLFQDIERRLNLEGEAKAAEVMATIDLQRYIISAHVPELPDLWLLKAGRFGEDYSRTVNGFDWVSFYQRSPHIFQLFAQRLRQDYQYILIDSRTGVTDTSGICTALMPQKLVTVFTPNQQSLAGVLQTVKRATDYRKQSDDLNPLMVYPVPSRVETSETSLRAQWRMGTSAFSGYQPSFEQLFSQVYELPTCDLEDYFDDVQIQHFARYSYGEEIAVLNEEEGDRLSLTSSYAKLTERLLSQISPWEYTNPEARAFDPAQSKKFLFDVYLLPNNRDLEARNRVREIAHQLRDRGLNPWFDEEQLIPGDVWQDTFERVINQVGSVAIFMGSNGIDRSQRIELTVLLAEFSKRGLPIIPVLLPSADLSLLPDFLSSFAYIDWRSQPNPLEQLIWGITGHKPKGKLKG
jgi:MinD-like ATPase involved in chromosome partitioning or flagellar assembly